MCYKAFNFVSFFSTTNRPFTFHSSHFVGLCNNDLHYIITVTNTTGVSSFGEALPTLRKQRTSLVAAEVCQCTRDKASTLSASVQYAMVVMRLDAENEHQSQFNASWSLTCVSFEKKWLQVHPV